MPRDLFQPTFHDFSTRIMIPSALCNLNQPAPSLTHIQPKILPVSNPVSILKLRFAKSRRGGRLVAVKATMILPENPIVSDLVATVITGGVALSALGVWGETAKRGFFGPNLNRKLVHISIGLIFMLCWPLFSDGKRGALLAALVPGINVVKMIVLGTGMMKDEATVKSMTRFGDHRELLKGPLYYGVAATLACAICWRTSPIAIAVICNLCAGDGLADIIGRNFGSQKLPHNENKSFAGSIAMAIAGFLASVAYMYYFSMFGYISVTSEMIWGFLAVSLGAALVESLPISTTLDDNLTVPLTSVLLGSLIFTY